MPRRRNMGGPDMPRPGTPAARAMAADNVRTGMSNPWRYDPNERVPGAPAPRPVRLSNTSPRPRSGVIPVASLPAEPAPMRGPGQRMGGPDPAPMPVMYRAQMWGKLPGNSGPTGVSGADMQAFRQNYRATHKARLTPAQEVLLARYVFNQNPDNILFGDPGTLQLGRR